MSEIKDGDDNIEIKPPETQIETKSSFASEMEQNYKDDIEPGAEISHEEFFKEINKLDAVNSGIREDVVNDPECFDADSGKVIWAQEAERAGELIPIKDGAYADTIERTTLQPGEELVRYNTLDGEYFAPEGTTYEQMSLPYDKSKVQESHWVVTEPIEVEKGIIAPDFHQEGGGIQYKLNPEDTLEKRSLAYESGEIADLKDTPSNLAYEGRIEKVDVTDDDEEFEKEFITVQDETEISESETEEEEEKKGLSEMYYGFCDKVIAFSEFASENKLTEAADHVTGGDVGEALDVLVQFKEYFEAAVNSPKAQELFDKVFRIDRVNE